MTLSPPKIRPGAAKKPKISKEDRRKKYTEIARNRRKKQQQHQRTRHQICYLCRKPGHSVSQCPSKTTNGKEAICYKCGSTEHALSKCPKKNEGDPSLLPFATCFLCGEMGHLISFCPRNKKGIYVNGGQCRRCGSRQHLSSKCPVKEVESQQVPGPNKGVPKDDFGSDELLDGNVVARHCLTAMGVKRKTRVVNF